MSDEMSLFAFSLGNSVHDMWEAEVYPLAVMILLFSGVWPYVKLGLMLCCWIAPLQKLSASKRESLLMWLDALGKYSLVDAYVLVMMMVAFRFHVSLQDEAMVVDVLVTPRWGFYGFLLATMTSLAVGHIVLAYHRHCVSEREISSSERSETLMDHVFVVDGRRMMLTVWCKRLTCFLIIVAMILLAIGIGTDSFNFEFKGAAGLFLEDPKQSYSVLTLGQNIPKSVSDPNDFGIRWIEITYFLFAVGMPFTCLMVMLLLLYSNLTIQSATRLYVLAEIANAWSAMEVLCMSVIAALLEISQFAAFIIGDKCDGINKFLAAFLDKPLDGDDVCFDVVATLAPSCGYLFGGSIVCSVVSWGMLQLAHAALEERVGRENAVVEKNSFMGGDRSSRIEGKGKKTRNIVEKMAKNCIFRCMLLSIDDDEDEGGVRNNDYRKLGGGGFEDEEYNKEDEDDAFPHNTLIGGLRHNNN
jgi:hypothetical protein